MFLIETDDLKEKIDHVKIIDCSWHMPQTKRNGLEEYKENHIPNAIFFDLEKNSNQNSNLPHMLTDKNSWEIIVSEMGINNNDDIVVYDNSDVLSACRCWYNFIYFGHNPNLVRILNGGMKKWKSENKTTTNAVSIIKKTQYYPNEKFNLVKNKKQINKNLTLQNFTVIDARSKDRFEGKVQEPRHGLRSGSIPKSFCIPFEKLINNNNTFKDKDEIKKIFKEVLKDTTSSDVVFSCGSGITACVLALAYCLINAKYMPIIYDGSWAEYGKI